MKRLFLLSMCVVATALFTIGCGGTTPPEPAAPSPPATDEVTDETGAGTDETGEAGPADIVDTAVATDGFATLVAAVQAADLVETLKGEGPFTVFAPTDDAFAKLPAGTLDDLLKPENKDKLIAILTYHVVPGKVMAADVVELESAKTVQGGEVAIAVEEGTVKVDGANVTATDIECANGVIHVIDAVILPPSE